MVVAEIQVLKLRERFDVVPSDFSEFRIDDFESQNVFVVIFESLRHEFANSVSD